jgi:ankyrin repeat protein
MDHYEANTVLRRAAERGDATNVQKALDAGADVNGGKGALHTSPLQYAASRGHAEIVRLLLAFNANVNARNEFNESPLHWAVQARCASTIRLLIEHGANPDLKDDDGYTPRSLAKERGFDDIMQLLDGCSQQQSHTNRVARVRRFQVRKRLPNSTSDASSQER